jgi:L-ascorbate metabolism protein UlaG (beta-lactamase superfamily)
MTDSARSGHTKGVRLEYLGHCAFRMTTPGGTRIVVDPFRNSGDEQRWFLRPSPPVEADVLVITHPHFDHDAVDSILGEPGLIDEAGEIRGEDYVLRTLAGRHARDFAVAIGYKNLIVVLESGGVRICLAADNWAEIEDELRDEIGPVDLLTVAVDDEDLILDTDEATRLVDILGPKVVLPTHYLIEGLTDPESGLGGIKNWRASQARVRDLEGSAVMITADGLPKEREGWVFGSCVALEDGGGS